ncbi:MAG: aminofutalosine synthase MqnE [Acidobacteriota bacterium]|nr:aminofutalosine synthase MqnE [Acidobacteriota bacterium]MDQ5872097.1 aminofutalosine synthase MqnE [Acidobacteriota bacterium]
MSDRAARIAATFGSSDLAPIAGKVLSGERLSFDDGVHLFQTRDFLGLGRLANFVREERHGNVAHYNVNRYLNPTNLCWVDCALCAWAKKVNEPGGYELAIDECVEEAGRGYSEAVTEFHIVGGLHPTWPYEYYTGLLAALKERFPGVHLKAFTMVEIDWIARIGNRSIVETIRDLRAAGMHSCPGGGAEIFERKVRDVICRNKISGERWLEIARECHREGVRTNATILYGHVETVEDRVDHLLRLRTLQDETGGFTGLIPLAFHPENTPLAHLPATSGQLDLRVVAASRLLLDNFPHVKAYWIQIGTRLAQVALYFGADDLVGTVVDETITHAAGATTASGLTRTEFERMIRETGREPFERDADYRRVVRDAGGLPRAPVPREPASVPA